MAVSAAAVAHGVIMAMASCGRVEVEDTVVALAVVRV
jgi:hypothetical protein